MTKPKMTVGKKKKPKTKTKAVKKIDRTKPSKIVLKEGTYLHSPGTPYPPAVRNTAKLLYVSGQASLQAIEAKLGVPYSTLRHWHATESWARSKTQVIRFANKEIVRSSRKAMGAYVKNIDDMINKVDGLVNRRLGVAKEVVEDEEKLLKLGLEVIKLKIALIRALSSSSSNAFIPSPGSVEFDNTAPKTAKGILQGLIPSSKDVIGDALKGIPDYMKDAAEFVIGLTADEGGNAVEDEDIPQAVIVNLTDGEAMKDVIFDDLGLDDLEEADD